MRAEPPAAEAGTPPPCVSVILNIRNGGLTLAETLESLLAQTYRDWEAICWDDCSGDGSAAIVQRYRDPRIRYFLSPGPVNLARSREAAIGMARGRWLAFLDQDDLWMPEKLERQMELIEREPAARIGLIYGRTVSFDERGRQRDYDYRHEMSPLPEGRIFTRLFEESCFIAMSSAVIRAEAYRELGGIPRFIEVTPDYYMFVGVAYRWEARAVQQVICRYRRHAGNMSHRSHKRINAEILLLIDRWAGELPPALARRRRQVHHTVIAAYDLFEAYEFGPGMARLVREGSIPFLLTRPFAKAHRRIRAWWGRPVWRRGSEGKRLEAPPEGAGTNQVPLLGTPVNAATFAGAREFLRALVERRKGGYISCANAYGLMLALDSDAYQRVLNGAAWVTADGMPVVWWLRKLGWRAERVHNDDLCLDCCARFAEWRHFLVGGREGQAEAAAKELRRRFPGIRIAGTHATPKRPVPAAETEAIIGEIEAARADIVWVGMGTPAQDYWMAEACGRLNMPLVAVGSLFDLLVGRTRPAPDWVKRNGLQWLFRLIQEPRRLGSRYVYYNCRFALAVAREMASSAFRRKALKGS